MLRLSVTKTLFAAKPVLVTTLATCIAAAIMMSDAWGGLGQQGDWLSYIWAAKATPDKSRSDSMLTTIQLAAEDDP